MIAKLKNMRINPNPALYAIIPYKIDVDDDPDG
jgi:hypothetical protein